MSLPKHISDAIHEYVSHMEGWTTPERCCEIAECILETKAKVCIDIGVFAGRSTIAMGFAARQLVNSKVYGIDPWTPEAATDNDDNKEGVDWWKDKANLEDMQRQAVRSVWNHRLEQWVIFIRSRSEYVYDLFPEIEFLNIDGGHSEISSCRDVELYLPRVKSGYFVTMDDTAWPSTQKAVKMLAEQCELINVTKAETESRTYRKR
jgi:hypothetical protein